MPNLARIHVSLDDALLHDLSRLVKSKGGRKKGYTISSELNRALQEYLQRNLGTKTEAAAQSSWAELLQEKFGQQEAWLRGGVWGGAIYSATSALLMLELLCGTTVDPKDARNHFELVRGRAWKLVRRDPEKLQSASPEGGG